MSESSWEIRASLMTMMCTGKFCFSSIVSTSWSMLAHFLSFRVLMLKERIDDLCSFESFSCCSFFLLLQDVFGSVFAFLSVVGVGSSGIGVDGVGSF